MRVGLVVPCFNEAARLRTEAFESFLARSPWLSLVFVDDGSRDRTGEILDDLHERIGEQVEVIHFSANRGKAEAVREGMRRALRRQVDVVGFWDADLATPLEAVHDLLQIFPARPDIDWVFGARVKLLGRHIERRRLRHYTGRVFATCVSIFLHTPIYDTQCGAKLFRATDELGGILEEAFVSRWIFDVELIARLLAARALPAGNGSLPIFEYPLHSWNDVHGSQLRGRDYLRAAIDLYRIHRSLAARRGRQSNHH